MKRRTRKTRRRKKNCGRCAHAILKTKEGRKALARYRRFWGIKRLPSIKRIELPGPKNKTMVLVGLGRSPAVHVANGPKGRATKKSRRKHRGRILASDTSGRRMFILSGRNSKQKRQKLKYLGYVPVSEYIPSKSVESAGSFKRGKHWIHKQGEDGGTWPKLYRDQAGNYMYSKGTYKIGKWIYD